MGDKVINLNSFKKETSVSPEVEKVENIVKEICVTYSDGTTKIVSKGAVITLEDKDKDEYTSMDLEFTKINNIEMLTIVQGFSEFVTKSGILEFILGK